MPLEPAEVNGSERPAVVFFIEDANEDLVDIEYSCLDCTGITAFWWPAFDFGDQDIHCRNCGTLIQKGRCNG